MKTNKKYLAASIATITIIALWIGSTSAMTGQWTWEQGKRWMSEFITAEQRVEVENMTQEDRQEFIQKMRNENGITTDRISNRDGDSDRSEGKKWDRSKISQFITEAQKNELRDMTQEERKAFIQNLRAKNGLSNENKWDKSERGENKWDRSENRWDKNEDCDQDWEGSHEKRGFKKGWEGRNK